VAWKLLYTSSFTSLRFVGAASALSGLSLISVSNTFINGFSFEGIVYSGEALLSADAINDSIVLPLGKRLNKSIVEIIIMGIAITYPLIPVATNSISEKYVENRRTAFRASAVVISFVGTNLDHVSP
jgi:hypothetical protein